MIEDDTVIVRRCLYERKCCWGLDVSAESFGLRIGVLVGELG